MSRLGLVCASALLLLSLPAHAQDHVLPSGAWIERNAPAPRPEPAWEAANRVNPRFPITVRLDLQDNRYDGFDYAGSGTGHVFNPQGENIEFRYRCDLTFSVGPTEFYARWVKPGRKLEILLEKPGTTRTRTCRVSTLVVAP